MRTALLAAAVLLVTASCAYPPEMFREDAVVPELPPPPPERVLRRPPDFTFRDHVQKKQFFIRVYSEEGFKEEIITVVDLEKPNEDGERVATLDEYDFALAVFEEEWLRQGHEERLRYHLDLRARELQRNATLLADMVRLTRHSLEQLRGWKFDTDADLTARKATGAFLDPQEVSFLSQESGRLAVEIAAKEAQLSVLEYKLWLSDQKRGRTEAAQYAQEVMDVGDLLPFYTSSGALLAEIRSAVQPGAWLRVEARLEITDRFLVVRNTRPIVLEVRAYLSKLAERFNR